METILTPMIANPGQPLPRSMFVREVRHTVMVGVASHDNGFAVIKPIRDPTGHVWMPPQGPVGHRRSLFAAGRHVLREEIPSLKRPHRHGAPIIDWDSALYAGSAINEHARSGRCKMVHVVLFRTNTARLPVLRSNGTDCVAAQWVFSDEMLEHLLKTTQNTNPTKAHIVMEAAWTAKEKGWLN